MTRSLPPSPDPLVPRRAFLKHAGLAAAGAVAIGHAGDGAVRARDRYAPGWSGVDAAAGAVAAAARVDFRVLVDGAPAPFAANLESLAIDDIVIDVRETTTGLDVEYRTYGPGDAHFGKATFRCRVGKDVKDDGGWRQWWRECESGRDHRKSISVICLKRDGSPARTFNLVDCFPAAYVPGEMAAGDRFMTERLVLQIGRVEMLAHGESPRAPDPRFEIAIAGAGGGVPGAGPAAAAAEVDRSWESLQGGAAVLDMPDPLAGCAADRTTTPGHKYIDTLTLRGPLTPGRRALCAWFVDTVGGGDARRSVTVREAAKDGSPARTFTFHDCFPTRYVFPTFAAGGTGNLYEEVAIKPIRLELA